jgi:hypothetical protein
MVVSWPADRALASGYTLRQGRPPSGSGEVVLDAATAVTGRWRLGDTLALASTAGLIAAAVPARRAARLNPLTAIGTQ